MSSASSIMKTMNVFLEPEAVLQSRLQALAGQIRAEVDQAKDEVRRVSEEDDRFNTSTYRGPKVFRRQHHVRPGFTKRGVRSVADRRRAAASVRLRNLALAQPGELLLGDWLKIKCKELKRDRSWVLQMLRRGQFPGVTERRVNARLIFVRPQSAVLSPQSKNGERSSGTRTAANRALMMRTPCREVAA
jgi:hypothetical protein